jgi:heme-degrading monooxygenase HmoA
MEGALLIFPQISRRLSAWKGVVMSLTSMVERTVIPGVQGEIKEMLKELRLHAAQQLGFISGRTVVDAFNPATFMTISNWSTMGAWEKWENNLKRVATIDRMKDLLQNDPVSRLWLHDEDAPAAAP